jgi:hypothetical protein
MMPLQVTAKTQLCWRELTGLVVLKEPSILSMSSYFVLFSSSSGMMFFDHGRLLFALFCLTLIFSICSLLCFCVVLMLLALSVTFRRLLRALSRQHDSHRLDNDTYRFAFLRRLRLPTLPTSLIDTKCSCGKDLDPFGDHVFSCPNTHKGQLSHAIRDTELAHLLRTLAPLAAFTDSTDSTESITTETPCLAPNDLRKRPADVGMHLLPTYLRTQSPHHARFLAIDVTIPAPPPSSDASTTAATATTQHHQAERAKFSVTGNRSYVRVFEDLVNQQILLLPFTVDHLGRGIGTLGHRLLFGHDRHKARPTNYH